MVIYIGAWPSQGHDKLSPGLIIEMTTQFLWTSQGHSHHRTVPQCFGGHPLLWGDTSELKHVQNKPHLCRFHGMSTVAPFGSALGVFPSPGQHHCQPQGSVSLPNVPPTNPLRVHMSHTNESPAIPVVVPTPRPHQQSIHTKGRWTHHKILPYSPSPAASTPSIPKKGLF